MASVVRMPSVLAGATEAAIATWLVAPGDTVTVGVPLAEIETEKAIVEYSAEEAGVVGRLVLAAGDSGEIGAPIAVLVKDGETDADIDAALGGEAAPPALATPSPSATPPALATPAPSATPATSATPTGPATLEPSTTSATPVTLPPASAPDPAAPPAPDAVSPSAPVPSGPAGPAVPAAHRPYESQPDQAPPWARLFASPIVRRLAREQGIDLATVEGTGPNGRIVRRDLERLAGQSRPAAGDAPEGARPVPQPAVAQAAPQPGAQGAPQRAAAQPDAAQAPAGATLIPHTRIRRAIARRLTESKATTPHFYLTTECVVDELLELRGRINETAPVKISVNDFVIMAVAAAFQDVPEANVTWSDEGLVAPASVDVSIAVATEGGLVTPVLRGVGAKRLSVIAAEARSLAERARNRRLQQHELEGGVFSISNLGMYGTLEFSAIINPPQSGILAVGAAKPQAVVVDGAVTVATVMRCTLSVDHRAIDGALAARWLAAFTARIQDPLGMLV
jgi:pyruvate dehydrogenase E2 component (dihydrolipoamide acetyltransferase)